MHSSNSGRLLVNKIKQCHQNTIAIDFDGVIHQWSGDYGPPAGPPVQGAIKALKALVAQGKRVVIFSARLCCHDQDAAKIPTQYAEVEAWLLNAGALKDIHYHSITGCKPVASLYIDDNALRFVSWDHAEHFMRTKI
jgi:hypothetical protein